MKKTLFSIGVALMINQAHAQKVYVNEEWTNFTGNVSNFTHTSSVATANGGVVVVSNTINNSGNSDVLISKYKIKGQLDWQTTFDGTSNANDYGIKVTTNANGELFVIASIGVSPTDNDFGVLKYDIDGNLIWSYTWDGENGMDAPSDILLDDLGAIYVVGGTQSSNSFSDYAILKIKPTGDLEWETFYDYIGLHDAAVSIAMKGNLLYVAGTSASQINSWDNATIVLDKGDASLLSEFRASIPGNGLDMPKGIVSDNNNNIYVTGYVEVDGNKDIQLLKINSDFTIEWMQTFDGGFEDEPAGLGLDANGNIYVTGFTRRSNGIQDYITIKYDTDGNQLWAKSLKAEQEGFNGVATGIAVKTNGELFVTGTIEETSGRYFNTAYYTTQGELKSLFKYHDQTNTYQEPNLALFGNDLYLTGIRNTGGNNTQTSIRYNITERSVNVAMQDSIESHVANEIVIRFGRQAMNSETINDKRITFGLLPEFVDSVVIDSLFSIYPSLNWDRVKTYKIFPRMTMADSISISRNGHTVEVQPFWATLLINIGTYNELEVIDSIKGRAFPLIQYLHTNDLFSTQTDDPSYPVQLSLISDDFPEAHINVVPAWNFEQGQSNVKVGVYDTGVRWSHEDLGGGFNCPTCKVKGGWDYQLETSIANTANEGDPNGHGTAVAGVIGALRNNNIGIAGIAGGDMDNNNIGVSIHGFRAIGLGLSLTDLCNALVEGSLSTTNGFGYGMDVMNNSWKRNTPYNSEIPLVTAQTLFEDTQREIFRSQTTFIASRGNQVNTEIYFPSYAKREYWVINVGGSNTQGDKHTNSGYAGDVDFIAPHSDSLVYTLDGSSTNTYAPFSGTSSAAAHATGVAALMMSYINDQPTLPNDLAPDDVEFLLQRYATDRNQLNSNVPYYTSGYDQWTGWGLLNAGNVMQHIDRSQYIIKHYTLETPLELLGESIEGTFYFGDENMPGNTYYGEIFSLPYYIPNNLYPSDVIIDYWPLNSYATLLADENFIQPFGPLVVDNEAGVEIYGMTHEYADVRGHVVHIMQDPAGNPIDYWYPAAPGELIRVGYTLHIQTEYAGIDEVTDQPFSLMCYPNPTNDQLTIQFESLDQGEVSLTIYDVNGRLVAEQQYAGLYGKQQLKFDASDWTNGMYFVTLTVNDTKAYAKVIKH